MGMCATTIYVQQRQQYYTIRVLVVRTPVSSLSFQVQHTWYIRPGRHAHEPGTSSASCCCNGNVGWIETRHESICCTQEYEAPIPYLGMSFEALNYWDVFLGGYFVLLGIRGIFELLKQVISRCPKTYRPLRYEYEDQHCIKNPNTVLLVRPICPEM